MDITDQLTYLLVKEHTLRSADWVALLIYGRQSNHDLELLLAQVIHFLFTAMLGLLYVYFIAPIKIKNHLFKGWLWSTFVWFVAITLTISTKIPALTEIDVNDFIFHFLLASIYGLTLAAANARLAK